MISEDTRLWLPCTLGSQSHLNKLGKVVFFVPIMAIYLFFVLMDTCFWNGKE